MYLTEQEHEAFMRGRAAGLIPEDYPLPACDKEIDELRKKKESIIKEFADKQSLVKQLIDIALLQNGMLKGQSLSQFIKRTIDMI